MVPLDVLEDYYRYGDQQARKYFLSKVGVALTPRVKECRVLIQHKNRLCPCLEEARNEVAWNL